MLLWESCGNHKLALCFKYLLPSYETIQEIDTFFESLWKFFKCKPLAMNLLDKCDDIFAKHVIFPVGQVLCDGLLMSVRARLLLNATTNFS